MGTVNYDALDRKTRSNLTTIGWTPGRSTDGKTLATELHRGGFPVGRRGQMILDEFGGLVCPLSIPPRDNRESLASGVSLRTFLGLKQRHEPPILSGGFTHVLSFTPNFISEACNPETLLYCACFSLGHLVSVVAATTDDRVILVDEESHWAYIWDILAEVVCPT